MPSADALRGSSVDSGEEYGLISFVLGISGICIRRFKSYEILNELTLSKLTEVANCNMQFEKVTLTNEL